MREIETDYLVVGAGASGMAFVDTLIQQSDADVLLVDRRHRPGGHWNDAYPFVRLHQPAAWYGVGSRVLEADHMDVEADRAGLATGTEVCEYYLRVLEDHFLASGQVRFLGMTDYRGGSSGTYTLASLLSGEEAKVKVRRRLVDARYPEMSIPSRHTPSFAIDPGVRVIPPNDLVDLDESPSGYTVIGAGKTSMDTCYWLLEQAVPPEDIRWIRPRDAWMMDRAAFRPADGPAGALTMQAIMAEAAAAAASGRDLAARLEAAGLYHRLDASIEPDVFRGATVSRAEAATLRTIENVVRLGKVVRISLDTIILTEGAVPTDADHVYIDCTAAGVAPKGRAPIFRPDGIELKMTTFGIIPWSAALIAYVEANRDSDDDKNRLCPVVQIEGEIDSTLSTFLLVFKLMVERAAEPDLSTWMDGLRLNPANGLNARLDDPEIQAKMATIGASMPSVLAKLEGVGVA
jgi:hypothetical protein